MTVTIYANYGVLAHEKRTAYTAYAPAANADHSEQIVVIIPDVYEPYITQSNEIALTLNGTVYLLSEVLSNTGTDKPCLKWYDGHSRHTVILHIA